MLISAAPLPAVHAHDADVSKEHVAKRHRGDLVACVDWHMHLFFAVDLLRDRADDGSGPPLEPVGHLGFAPASDDALHESTDRLDTAPERLGRLPAVLVDVSSASLPVRTATGDAGFLSTYRPHAPMCALTGVLRL